MTPEQMRTRLLAAFPNAQVDIIDLTGTEDHYQVSVLSTAFAGKPRIAQHQMVMDAFSAELKSGEVHALTIKTGVK